MANTLAWTTLGVASNSVLCPIFHIFIIAMTHSIHPLFPGFGYNVRVVFHLVGAKHGRPHQLHLGLDFRMDRWVYKSIHLIGQQSFTLLLQPSRALHQFLTSWQAGEMHTFSPPTHTTMACYLFFSGWAQVLLAALNKDALDLCSFCLLIVT